MPALVALTLISAGCLRPVRDVPFDPSYTWGGYLGGPSHDAFATETVSESMPTVEWSAGAGRGLDAPVTVLGPVIVSATTNRMVIAVSSESGDVYWEHRKNGPFQSTPLSDGERLYLATADTRARVYALRLRDGKEQWEKTYPGLSSPMILTEDRLFFLTEPGILSAVRTRNGDRLWDTPLGAPAAAAPLLANGRIVAATTRDSLYALSPDDGRILARRSLPGRVSAPPAAAPGSLFVPLQSGHVLSLDDETLEERWRTFVGGSVSAAPIVTADGTLYTLSRSGQVWTVSADGQPVLLVDLASAAKGALTVTSNAVLVGLLDGRLVASSRADGSELWSMDMGDSVQSPAIVQDGAIYVPLRRGQVVKLR